MTLFWSPRAELLKLEASVNKQTDDSQLRDNALYHAIHGRACGLCSGNYLGKKQPANIWSREKDGSLVRLKTRMSRREWIEVYFFIRDKDGLIGPMRLNRNQRRMEAVVLKLERQGVPVRVLILKARQMGFSTYVQALMYYFVLGGENVRGLIVADKDERSKTLLSISDTARVNIPKKGELKWNFKMQTTSRSSLAWQAPINGNIEITAATAPNPGRGGTRSIMHWSETAHWIDAEHKQADILDSLPLRKGTFLFDESTANGDSGKFRDDYWNAKGEEHLPLHQRETVAFFAAWWEHEEYFWSKTAGGGRPLPVEMGDVIFASLDKEEEWLLEQTYFQRGQDGDPVDLVEITETTRLVWDDEGNLTDSVTVELDEPVQVFRRRGICWTRVNADQLQWRRLKLRGKHFAGNTQKFNQEHPSRDELAFISSGDPVFNPAFLTEYVKAAERPAWRGDLPEVRETEAAFGEPVRFMELDE